MSVSTKRAREEIECTCGCQKTSVWECYNSKQEDLKRELKRTKLDTESIKRFGIIIIEDNNDWIIEHEDPEYLADTLCSALKEKISDKNLQSALNMLEDCEVEEIPLRAVYVLNQVNIDN